MNDKMTRQEIAEMLLGSEKAERMRRETKKYNINCDDWILLERIKERNRKDEKNR